MKFDEMFFARRSNEKIHVECFHSNNIILSHVYYNVYYDNLILSYDNWYLFNEEFIKYFFF